jgi:predicted ATPase
MFDEITDQLEEYFKNSKQEFSFGVQNFQGIREYTQVPLAPLTLIYGQNSAGKSTVHDALNFIHGYFGGSWDDSHIAAHLDRWANYKRAAEPLKRNYLGHFDDVVLSLRALTGDQDYFRWESSYHQNQDFVEGSLAYQVFVHGMGQNIPFRIDIHFSNTFRSWHVRQFSLYLGEDIFLELIFDDFDQCDQVIDEYGLLRLNKQHPVYALLNTYFRGQQEQFKILETEPGLQNENWFEFKDIDVNFELGWHFASARRKLISWSEVDSSSNRPSAELLEFRTFILSLLQIPTQGIADNFNFNNVPPLRPIPSKKDAIFRRFSPATDALSDWAALADKVFLKLVYEAYPVDSKDQGTPFLQLNEINRILSHPFFLNTDYELTGECHFLAPIGLLKEIYKSDEESREKLTQMDAEIHLKLMQKSTGYLTEIEDVGVGISQIIPVLVAITQFENWQPQSYRAFIQQPELHLHPKLQAQLADAFVACVNKNLPEGDFPSFIVESHSEHFLLRLLRRIRETYRSDIKNKLTSLSVKDVSVIYVDKLEDGSSKIFPLRISPDGEFIDRWPHGFFTERDGELFDE